MQTLLQDLRYGARMLRKRPGFTLNKMNCVAMVILFLLVSTAQAHGQTRELEAFAAEIEQLRNLLKIPGLSVAIVKGKKVWWAHGFGYRDYENKLPATPETLYPIASLTKTFASTLVMQMVEQRRLRLTDSVAHFRADSDVDPATTVRHYLTHTSEAEPGRYFFYSGARFGRLTTILEKASGQSFRALVAERIFKAAGMTGSVPGLGVEGYERTLSGLSRLYVRENDQFVRTDYWKGINAASGAISSVLDLARYDIALSSDVFISKQSRAEMATPGQSNSGQPLPYGLGWFIQDFNGQRVLWAYGQEDNNSALLLKVPKRDLTLIVLANSIALSDPFWLILGNVKRSPFALAFLHRFVSPPSGASPNWNLEPDALAGELTRLDARGAQDRYTNEIIARAFAYQWLGERTRSVALLKLALARAPHLRVSADPALLAVCARSGATELRQVGEQIGKALLAEQPDQPRALFDLAVLYQQAQQREQAIPLLERIVANPHLSARWMLAYSGFSLGEFFLGNDTGKAKKYLRLVLASGTATGSLQQRAQNLLVELEKR